MQISIPGKNNGNLAFTLIELSVVLFLISLILWTVLPKLSVLSGEDNGKFLRKMAARLELTMEEAIFTAKGGRIEINISEGLIESYTGEGKEKRKSVKLDFYERLKVGDRIKKYFFSFTYEVNNEKINPVTAPRFLFQTTLIYLFLSGEIGRAHV